MISTKRSHRAGRAAGHRVGGEVMAGADLTVAAALGSVVCARSAPRAVHRRIRGSCFSPGPPMLKPSKHLKPVTAMGWFTRGNLGTGRCALYFPLQRAHDHA